MPTLYRIFGNLHFIPMVATLGCGELCKQAYTRTCSRIRQSPFIIHYIIRNNVGTELHCLLEKYSVTSSYRT